MKTRERKKKRMLKRAIVSLCAVLLIFTLIYYVIGTLKKFAVENVAKSAESELVQTNNSINGSKHNTDDNANQSGAKESEIEKQQKVKIKTSSIIRNKKKCKSTK